MTEAEWLSCDDPQLMLQFLRDTACSRKLRLFAISCCRRWIHLLVAETLGALETAELFAEGKVDSSARKQARELAFQSGWNPDKSTAHRRGPAKACVTAALARCPCDAAIGAEHMARHIGALSRRWDITAYEQTELGLRLKRSKSAEARVEQAKFHAGIIKDIFGNPFRQLTLNNSWLTPTVVALSASIYEERAFDRMPILADALQDAGCDNEEILNHCRQPGEHVRGCFLVDWILGKS
jgi:hypothetical protein